MRWTIHVAGIEPEIYYKCLVEKLPGEEIDPDENNI
jgi:hypothetical protein